MQYTGQVIIVQLCLCIAISLCEVLQKNEEHGESFDIYKNKEIIQNGTLPDLTALNFGHVSESKVDYFNKLVLAWENLNFNRNQISKGESLILEQ